MNILLTGATGYIGRRLLLRLKQEPDVSLRVLVRNARKLNPSDIGDVRVIEGDTFKCASLVRALKGIDVAYYLINLTGAGGISVSWNARAPRFSGRPVSSSG